MTWTKIAWQKIEPIYEKILELDFVRELGNGELDRSRFLTYIEQDKLYLNDYSQALALVAARAPTAKDTAMFSQFAQNTAIAEQGLHDYYLNEMVGNVEQLSSAKKNVTCELYTNFLLRHAACSPIEVAAAAILPCFWIYEKVGTHHTARLENCADRSQHPYAKWIETYSSPEFNADSVKACNFVNRLADSTTEHRRQEMLDAFIKASIMELMFWKSAWDDEKWIIDI